MSLPNTAEVPHVALVSPITGSKIVVTPRVHAQRGVK